MTEDTREPFNIHAMDAYDEWGEDSDVTFADYTEELIKQFQDSERGRALEEKITYPPGDWVGHFLNYGHGHLGVTPASINLMQADELINELLPAKVTVLDKEDARWAIPELIGFWSFLEEKYELQQASQIIALLKNVEANFPDMMVDPSRAGMAKSFLLRGQSAGYDMRDEQQVQQAFAQMQQEGLAGGASLPPGLGMPGFPMDGYPEPGAEGGVLSKKQRVKKKSKRKQQKASKKKNRKK